MTLQRAFLFFWIIIAIQLPQDTRAHSSLNQKTFFGKALGCINQSRMMYFFEKRMTKLPKLLPYGNEVASPEYQELGKEAQIAAGIPEEYHVPIKKIPSTHLLAPYVGAVAEPDAIYVNEEKLNQRPYGARRSALFHEAIHIKYNDMVSDYLLELVTFAGVSAATHVFIKAFKPAGKYKFLHALAVVFTGMGGSSYASSKYHYYIERRADIEGHFATGCPQCVHEAAQQRRIIFEEEKSPLRNNGYLGAVDLEKIAQELEEKNELCAFHAQITKDVDIEINLENS